MAVVAAMGALEAMAFLLVLVAQVLPWEMPHTFSRRVRLPLPVLVVLADPAPLPPGQVAMAAMVAMVCMVELAAMAAMEICLDGPVMGAMAVIVVKEVMGAMAAMVAKAVRVVPVEQVLWQARDRQSFPMQPQSSSLELVVVEELVAMVAGVAGAVMDKGALRGEMVALDLPMVTITQPREGLVAVVALAALAVLVVLVVLEALVDRVVLEVQAFSFYLRCLFRLLVPSPRRVLAVKEELREQEVLVAVVVVALMVDPAGVVAPGGRAALMGIIHRCMLAVAAGAAMAVVAAMAAMVAVAAMVAQGEMVVLVLLPQAIVNSSQAAVTP